jgi:acetoin:2,6-dichlorophenolindophenol oxidoreductase subunit alpha
MDPDVDPVGLDEYTAMVLIRGFEERAMALYREGRMPGLVHAYSGQEAVAVGVCAALRPVDTITSTHRGHGHCLAKGADPARMMAENLGRATGSCRGKGGSMHITDVGHGILGANGIVGGGAGIALGAAFSAQRLGVDRVSVCFLGDGAMNQGVVFETMNMAALWELPLVYVCEHNGFTEYTRSESLTAGTFEGRAAAFGIPAEDIDGMDLEAVRAASARAVTRARRGEGPTFLLMHTHRYHGHHVAELESGYRLEGELETWVARDPIPAFAARLLERGVSREALEACEQQVDGLLDRVVEEALAAPQPNPSSVDEDIYAEVG